MSYQIKCPHCQEEFEISDAITANIEKDHEAKIIEKARKDAALQYGTEYDAKIKLIQEELDSKSNKLAEAQKNELELRKAKNELEEQKKTFELDKQRQLDEERQKIRLQTLDEFSQSHKLKDLEKDKVISDLKNALQEAQLKASQSSQQLQGEVQELDLEEDLKKIFISDDINPVGKGVRGADIIQVVKTDRGNTCGTIIWESKRTKNWTDEWVSKLKEDLRSSKSDIAILITSVLPKEINKGFGYYQGIWVAEIKFAIPLAETMRQRLIDIAREKFINQNQAGKKDMLFSYIASNEFKQQVESLVEVYQEIQEQVTKERAAFEKIWKSRESQAQRLLKGTANIIGSIQGVAGQSTAQIKGLDLLEE